MRCYDSMTDPLARALYEVLPEPKPLPKGCVITLYANPFEVTSKSTNASYDIKYDLTLEAPSADLYITKVIYNNPATIVWWSDGSKTVVRCQKGDKYSPETGLAMAICKRVFGNDNKFNKVFARWLPHNEV